ncbi:MAG: WG repeat-containing protein [Clostridia bacterium]|nr:WG repeat-containing protein [Clostridia bacterium]
MFAGRSRREYYRVQDNGGLFGRYSLTKKSQSSHDHRRDERDVDMYSKPFDYNGIKVSASRDGLKIKIKDDRFVAERIYEFGNGVYAFEQKDTGEVYVFNSSAQVAGPLKKVTDARIGRDYEGNSTIYAIDTRGHFVSLDENLSVMDLQLEYVDENTYKDLTTGKYGVLKNDHFATPALFDTANLDIQEIDDKSKLVLENDTVHMLKNDKQVGSYEGVGKDYKLHRIYGKPEINVYVIQGKDKSYVVNPDTGEVLYQTAEKISSVVMSDGIIALNNGEGKATVLTLSDEHTLESTVEVPHSIVGIKNGVLQAKNPDGKCGLIDPKGNVLLPFEYDSFRSRDDRYGRDESEYFIGLEKDGKHGIYSTIDKKIAVPVAYKGVCLERSLNCDKPVVKYEDGHPYDPYYSRLKVPAEGSLFRFVFEGENGRYGIINSNGQVVVDSVLERTHSDSGGFYDSRIKGSQFSYNQFKFPEAEWGERDIFINTASPYLFPQTERTVYHREEKVVKETKTTYKYSEDQRALATLGGFILGGPIGAAIAHEATSGEVSHTTSRVEKGFSTSTEAVSHSAIAQYVHMDYAAMPEHIRPKNVTLTTPEVGDGATVKKTPKAKTIGH